jgi:two-component system, cell cycle sensor histidine kinase DivJ
VRGSNQINDGPKKASCERVELSSLAAPSSTWSAGLAAGCERLVHPSVAEAVARARHARLISVLMIAPFLMACGAGQTMVGAFGAAVTLAAVCAIFGLYWFAALMVAATGKDRPANAGILAVSSVLGGLIAAGAGGLGSPLAVMAGALVFEAAWVERTRSAVIAGLAASLCLVALQVLVGTAAGSSAWHWLVPLAYATTVGLRVAALFQAEQQPTEEDAVKLEHIIAAVVLRLGQNGEVLDASPKARDILRLPPEMLLGNGLFERVHVADRVAYLCALADMRSEDARSRRLELRLRLPSERASVNFRPFDVEFARSDDHGTTLVIRENDEVFALREKLAEAREAADRMDVTKGRFLATISHELRTPLNAIIGFSDILCHEMCGAFADPRQKEYVGLIKDAGDHLLGVVNSILDVTKLQSGTYTIHPEPFRFADAVSMCRSMLELQAAAKAISFRTAVGRDAGEVVGDRRAVQQMLINLASNAIKFTRDGGNVTIGAKRVGSRLHFWVSDDGIGISENDLERLGQPFVQVQNDYTRQFEGTGLGLSLVKGLVTLHEGTMSIESAPDEGTTVTISLPLAGPSTDTAGACGEGTAAPLEHGDIDGKFRKSA